MLGAFFLILLLAVIIFSFVFAVYKAIYRNNQFFIILFLVCYLPFYTTIQVLVFEVTGSLLVSGLFVYLKEFAVFVGILSWVLFRKNLLNDSLRIQRMDIAFLAFLGLAIVYALLPIGPASSLNKLIYLKNILALGAMYWLGRNMVIGAKQVKLILNSILVLIALAFLFNIFEKFTDTHFQTTIGYPNYLDVTDTRPAAGEGHYGLLWTFQASSGAKRFAAFFSSPLELAIVSVLGAITGFCLLMHTSSKFYRGLYAISIALSVGCLFFAYSRAAIGGFFLMLFFMAFVLRYYKLIYLALFSMVGFFTLIFLIGSNDLRFFIIDTLTFVEPSSFGHLLGWLEGIESMSSNPMGLGLGTSGNSGGVEQELQVGGENQFIIFGVQLGLIGLILYISTVYYSIKVPFLTFRQELATEKKLIPFVACIFKFAFLFSLMTANAETYLFVSYISWWMVGNSVQIFALSRSLKSQRSVAGSIESV